MIYFIKIREILKIQKSSVMKKVIDYNYIGYEYIKILIGISILFLLYPIMAWTSNVINNNIYPQNISFNPNYIKGSFTIIFITSLLNSAYLVSHPISITKHRISWYYDKTIKTNIKSAFVFLILAVLFNPFILFEFESYIWLVLGLLLIFIFSRHIYIFEQRIKDNAIDSEKFKSLIYSIDVKAIRLKFEKEMEDFTFEKLILLILHETSFEFLEENYTLIKDKYRIDKSLTERAFQKFENKSDKIYNLIYFLENENSKNNNNLYDEEDSHSFPI